MLVVKNYDRERALAYAKRWAFGRNPLYYDFVGIGGNCTNFVSQCLYAGCCTMNYTPDFGWYYLSPGERAPAWTGVRYFYNFLTSNRGVGPFGRECDERDLLPGDVIQLGREEAGYYHSLLVVGRDGRDLLVAAQSDDAYDRPLSTYAYAYARYLHVEGARLEIRNTGDCFEGLYTGTAILPDASSLPPNAPPDPREEAPEDEMPDGV